MMEISTVDLPPITIEGWTVENSTASKCEYCVIKATFSADPILHPNQCTVAVTYLGQLQLAFFRLGSYKRCVFIISQDITWNYVDQRHSLIDDGLGCQESYMRHGTIIMCQKISRDFKRERPFYEFEVFKLDFIKGEWIAKNTLGDIALFVRCEPDCIYCNHNYECMINNAGTLGPVDYGVYNVKTRMFSKAYGKFAKSLVKKAKQSPIWVSQLHEECMQHSRAGTDAASVGLGYMLNRDFGEKCNT
ncbi:unnamed protein product [Malus baccata var. baccata]